MTQLVLDVKAQWRRNADPSLLPTFPRTDPVTLVGQDDESPHVVNTGTMYDINWLHSCFSFAQSVPASSFATLGKHSIIIMLNIRIFGYPFPLL